jgi:hypothetical protein
MWIAYESEGGFDKPTARLVSDIRLGWHVASALKQKGRPDHEPPFFRLKAEVD